MIIASPLPLAANAQDFLEIVFAVVGVIVWILSHVAGGKVKGQPPARPRPAAPPRPPVQAGQAAQGGKPGTLEETLRREVEEFMRRAQGRPQQQAPQGQQRRPPAPSPQRGASPPRRDARPVRPATGGPSAPVRRLTDAPGATTTAQAPTPLRSMTAGAPTSIDQAVAEVVSGTKVLAAHAQHLGADVAGADSRMQEHLQEKFTHQLGALTHAETKQQKVVRSPAAQQLFEMLSRPGGMRQMVIASEILRRPEDRWARRSDS